MMKIAVASQNFRTVTGHAGKTRRFLIYEAQKGQEAIDVDRLDLPIEMAFHNFKGEGVHPVDGVDLMIVGSCGEGFADKMAKRGIRLIKTEETEPAKAIQAAFC